MPQRIVYGINSIIEQINSKRVLLVCDSAFDFLPLKSMFDEIPHVKFSDFTPNPLYEHVCEGVKTFNNNQCELIVAIGGGSTIDVAKCIKLYSKMDAQINYLKQEKMDTGIPLIAIPTTAGTGSESTQHAVIYFEGRKQSISHVSIVPNVAVLEPSLLKSLPLYQKKCTMLDALCQGIESWWSVNSTKESINYSKMAVKMISDYWKKYIFENTDEAAKKIMLAANYAGRAINISATTAPHAMSYKLTSLYKLPHGHAVAICMPEVWEYMDSHLCDCIDRRGKDYLGSVLEDIAKIISLDEFTHILYELKMEKPCSQNKGSDIAILTESVNPIRLKNNPVALERDVLQVMFERIIRL